jgi:cytochrome c-type biogenesis protein CcmH/NrfF
MIRVRSVVRSLLLGAVAALSLSLLAPGASAATPAAARTKDVTRAITDGIICPCSCGEILTGCTCETAKAMRADIERKVAAGRTKDQIEASLVTQYGEVILGAPKAKGFNLVVWVAPFVMTGIGILFATFILLRWVKRRSPEAGAAGHAAEPRVGAPRTAEQDLASLRARAEAELRNLRE